MRAAQAAFSRGWEVVVVEEGYFGLLDPELYRLARVLAALPE